MASNKKKKSDREPKSTMRFEFKDINNLFRSLERGGFEVEFSEFKYSTGNLGDYADEEVDGAYCGVKRCGEEISIEDPRGLEKITLEFNPSEIKGSLSHEDGNFYTFYLNVAEQYVEIYDDVRDKIEGIFARHVDIEN